MASKPTFDSLPDAALIRKDQLVRATAEGALSILPFSGTTLWRKVREGSFPKPIKVSGNITAWSVGSVRAWLRNAVHGNNHV